MVPRPLARAQAMRSRACADVIQPCRTHVDLCLRKTRADKSPDYRDVIVFEKLPFQNVFRPH